MSRKNPSRRTVSSLHADRQSRSQVQPAIESLENRQMMSVYTVNTFMDQVDPANSATTSLRDALARAAAHAGADIINVPAGNYKLTHGALTLNDTSGAVTLNSTGGTATIDAQNNSRVIEASASIGAALNGFKLKAGGIDNSGTLAVSNSIISDTQTDSQAFNGIENSGTMTLTNSTVTNNVADYYYDPDAGHTIGGFGGGIDNHGTMTVVGSTISGNYAAESGDGIYNAGMLHLSTTTISGNSDGNGFYEGVGGGIDNVGTLFVDSSTVSGNSATEGGGGIENTGTMTLTNTTISGNTSQILGGGIDNEYNGTASITNCTISANNSYDAGGIYNFANTIKVANSIIAGNSDLSIDLDGNFKSLGHNLIGQADDSTGWVASDHTGTSAHPLDARLAPLGNYGGPTLTQSPLAGSPAIGTGSTSLVPSGDTIDQRGFSRIVAGKVDIGAVELQKTSVITVTSPAAQNVVAGISKSIALGSFTDPTGKGPFTVVVNWGDGSPNSQFSVNVPGALAQSHAFTNTGSLKGSVFVLDRSGDVSQLASFAVSSAVAPNVTFTVNTTTDQVDPATSKTVSLRDAFNRATASFGPVTINFDPTVFATARTITLDRFNGQTLELDNNRFGAVTLNGPAAGITVAGTVDANIRIYVSDPVTATFNRFSISNGSIENDGKLTLSNSVISGGAKSDYSSIDNFGTMTLVNDAITNTTTVQLDGQGGSYRGGGGIDNFGAMTIVNSNISGNNATTSGGGIYNTGTLAITGSTIANNRATSSGSLPSSGGGIENLGSLTLNNSTVSGNSSNNIGGGIDNSGTLTVTNSTIAGNASGTGGGVNNQGGGKAIFSDSTLFENASYGGGGINNVKGTVSLANTIVAHNYGISATPDLFGNFKSFGHNLIGAKDGSAGWIASDLTGTAAQVLDARLSPLGNYGGSTQTVVPLAGSPAIEAGSVGLIPSGITTDQRGLPRTVGGKVDIGAVEIDKGGPFMATPASFGRVQAENFDFGGQNIAYFNPQNINKGGQYRPSEGVGISALPKGAYDVGFTEPGEWIDYTVNVAATGTYTLNFNVASGVNGNAFHLSVDDVNVTGSLAIPNKGWNTYSVVSKTGVHLTAGNHVLRLMIDSTNVNQGNGNFDWFEAVKTA